LPSNAHAYRLYIFKDREEKSLFPLDSLRSAKPVIVAQFSLH